jgi:flagellar biogenesis protein FliO
MSREPVGWDWPTTFALGFVLAFIAFLVWVFVS